MTQTVAVSSFLNQIFYKNNKFDDVDELSKLDCWMFSREKMEEWNIEKVKEHPIIKEKVKEEPVIKHQIKEPRNRFAPTKQDSLFWCAYAAHHGEAAYWVIGSKYKNVEIEEKHAMIEYIKTNSSKIRGSTPKISQVRLQEIMSNLMMNRKTDWHTFHIMCMFYNIQVSIIFDKTFLHFTNSLQEQGESFIFERSKDGHISMNYDYDTTKTCTLLQLEYMSDRPIKSITHYKLPELHDMAEKLGIDESEIIIQSDTETESKSKSKTQPKPKKIDWYNAILKKCTW